MATMGTRKLGRKKGVSPPPQLEPAPPPVDLTPRGTGSLRRGSGLHVVISSVQLAATTTLAGSTLGTPIMREGFVTETGFLPSSSADEACASSGLF